MPQQSNKPKLFQSWFYSVLYLHKIICLLKFLLDYIWESSSQNSVLVIKPILQCHFHIAFLLHFLSNSENLLLGWHNGSVIVMISLNLGKGKSDPDSMRYLSKETLLFPEMIATQLLLFLQSTALLSRCKAVFLPLFLCS